MRPVVTVEEMRRADADAPVPLEVLVQRAGRAVAAGALRLMGGGYGRRVVVVAGKGNNGADGRAAAAVLEARGARVRVVDAGDPGPLPGVDLVIDGAYGTGFRGAYTAPDPGGAPVLAIDVPSGLAGDTGCAGPGAVRAAATVTMAALKPGLLLGEGPARAGAVEVADIGLPVGDPATHLIEDADLAWLPPRSRSAHKWSSAVWVVAGSPGMSGALGLCATAAYRAGSGMVHAGSPGCDADDHPASETVAIGLPRLGWDETVLAELERFRCLVVGPGLGRSDATADAVRRLVAKAMVPVVVDADGLYALGRTDAVAGIVAARGDRSAPVVLTPHDGEFATLTGRSPGEDRIAAARDLARTTGAVVLLKGPTTVVASPTGRGLLAASGDARLATAGTGDVLSGVIGAFLATGLDAFEGAALAAHVHGLAARRGRRVGLIARDVPDLVADVLSSAPVQRKEGD